jgi:hypothetical protein
MLAHEIYKQLRAICNEMNIKLTSTSNNSTNIRNSLIHGFFMNAAEYQKENEFKTV